MSIKTYNPVEGQDHTFDDEIGYLFTFFTSAEYHSCVMASQEGDHLRPLCPAHHEALVSHPNAQQMVSDGSDTIDIHDCECPVDGCPQKYSPSLGYFTFRRNADHWNVTNSSSLSLTRRSTQVICGQHKDSMFIESFDKTANLENFRCPQKGCHQTMKLLSGGAPTYWLGSGYFEVAL